MAKSNPDQGIFHSENVSVFLSELLGTALLVFFGCPGCTAWGSAKPDLQIVLTFGFAVLFCVQIFGPTSGAHINPAVTIAAVIYRILSIQKALAYVVAQCVGAYMGYGLLVTLSPLEKTGPGFCLTKPSPLVSAPNAIGIEFVATATFVWVVCSVWDPRNSRHHDSVAIRIGLAVAGLASAIGPYTGGSMNPARSLGPALWLLDFESQWIYIVGPMLGGAVAATIYRYVFYRDVIEAEPIELQNIG